MRSRIVTKLASAPRWPPPPGGDEQRIPPPEQNLTSSPSYLWADANSLDGMFGDAFGIWRYPF